MKFTTLTQFLLLTALLVAAARTEQQPAISAETVDNLNLDTGSEGLDKLFGSSEKQQFSAQIDRMMEIIINSLYTHKDIFIRELISNANDALAKIQYLSLTDPKARETYEQFHILIKVNKTDNTLTIRDSGIGMTKEDLINNLGSIAKSGTRHFVQKLGDDKEKVQQADIANQIGQFGVGFYSSFLVADKVVVVSKNNNDPDQWVWESDSKHFKLAKAPSGNTLGRGTAVILHMREEAKEFLDTYRIKQLIQKYSAFINFPIYVHDEKPKSDDKKDDAKTEVDEDEMKELEESAKTDPEAAEKLKKIKEEQEKAKLPKFEYQHVNKDLPIFMRKPEDVSDYDHLEFYKATKGNNRISPEYIQRIHFAAEGDSAFRALLYIPSKLPENYMSNDDNSDDDDDDSYSRGGSVKLFVKRVFISGEKNNLLPKYLQFIVGVVDSDDLPLNIGRETLQQHPLIGVIKRKITRKVLDKLKKLEKDEYMDFYKEFSIALKYGVIEDNTNKNKLLALLRFHSSASLEAAEDAEGFHGNMTSLDDYIKRADEGQKEIYYLSCGSVEKCKDSPYLTRILNQKKEVIYMHDTIDEYFLGRVHEYNDFKFQNIEKEGAKVNYTNATSQYITYLNKKYKPLAYYWKHKSAFRKGISSMEITVDMEPSCLFVASDQGLTGTMERLVMSQARRQNANGASADPQLDKMLKAPKLLKINPFHPVNEKLLELVKQKDSADKNELKALTENCVAVAKLNGGYIIEDNLRLARMLEESAVRGVGFEPSKIKDEIRDKIKNAGHISESEVNALDELEEFEDDDEKKKREEEEKKKEKEKEEKKDDDDQEEKEAKEKDEL